MPKFLKQGNDNVRNRLLILAVILLLGLLLRVIFINSSPPSLYGDELTITLDAYSILKTGHDQLGNFLPLTFPMGAGRPAGYVYGSVPFVALFGPTALGVRTLSILSGVGIILLLYLVGKRLFSGKLGLLAAFMGAVSPWEISLSRAGFEAHFALFLFLVGVYLFIKAKERSLFYLFSALSFGLTLHTYPTYKVSLMLFLPLLFWFQGGRDIFRKGRKLIFGSLAILLSFGILSLSQIFIGGSETRFLSINMFSYNKDLVEQKINFERQVSELPFITNFFHNKPVEYTKILFENYLQNFSLDFLVLHGDRNPRHNMATMGQIYFIEVILIFIGILSYWQRQKKIISFLIFWVILSPVASSLIGLPHALRSSLMLPPLLILSALGLTIVLTYKQENPTFSKWGSAENRFQTSALLRNNRLRRGFLQSLKTWKNTAAFQAAEVYRKKVIFFGLVVFIIQFVFFIQKLYFLAPNAYSNFWSYPAKQASEIAEDNKDKFKFIVLSGKIDAIEFAYPVYTKVEPSEVIARNIKDLKVKAPGVKRYGNIYISRIPDKELNDFLDSLEKPVLFIAPADFTNSTEDNYVSGKDGRNSLILKRLN